MRLPLAALNLDVAATEAAHRARVYLDWNHSLPIRSQSGAAHACEVLERLFAANLLNIDIPEGPSREGDTLLLRGLPLRVKYVQDKRLVLELPPGRKFRHPEDERLITPVPRKAG
jgi:hypothetical protein